jgi:hypothetical protein
MFCRNCGKEVSPQAVMCVSCGVPPLGGKNFCQNCGAATNSAAVVCTSCGVSLAKAQTASEKEWLITLLLCIFLGGLGVHRFYTGHIAIGVIQLLTGGGCGIWWLIDIIMILTGGYKDSDGRPLKK